MAGKVEIGTKIDDKYIVESELGSGANGTVYLALEEQLGRKVAIKVLRQGAAPISRARFEREARALSLLTHPNIIHVFRYGFLPDDTPYIAMEFAEGTPLRELIETEECLRCNEAVDISMQICSALEFAHEKQIVHRDLKPENIMVNKSPSGLVLAKVLDFGLCKQESAKADQQASLTETGLILGTVLYMSPEQCLGKEPDWRTDIYSFGCILYEMITGSPPFVSDNAATVVLKHVSDPFPKILNLSPGAGLPDELQDILLKCTDKTKEKRYQSFSELKTDLATLRGLNSRARFNIAEASSPEALRMMKRIPKRLIQLSMLAVLIITLGVLSYLTLSENGNAILAMQLQRSLPANDAIEALSKLVEFDLKSKRISAAKQIMAESSNSATYAHWPLTDREELLKSYIQITEQNGMESDVFQLRVRLLTTALDTIQRSGDSKRKGIDKGEQLALVAALSKTLYKTKGSDSQKWKELYVVLEKHCGFLEGHRSKILCYLSALKTESMLHQLDTFDYPGLHDLAEDCYFTATATVLTGDDDLLTHFGQEAFRIGKQIDMLSVIHRMHVTMGMWELKKGRFEDAKKELALARESGKTLLLSTANTRRLECLASNCQNNQYVEFSNWANTHPQGPRAANPFMEFVGKK